jgi:hypothetical protein
LRQANAREAAVAHIKGNVADANDNDPVEIRGYQIQGTALGTILGYPPTTPIYHRGGFVYDNKFWRYYPHGMIASSENTCAHVLYGPIYTYYDKVGQFDGHLGFPTTDVKTLPDGTSYAAFDHGVLWLDGTNHVQEVPPVAAGLVKSLSGGLDPTGPGIAEFAQDKIQKIIADALASQGAQQNTDLVAQVQVTATVTFDSVGQGACVGAGLYSVGTSLPRSHTFRIHVEGSLTGCFGIFGDLATADLHVTARLQVVDGSKVSVYLEGYSIDSVKSPAGAFDGQIRGSIMQALNSEYHQDLLNQQLPASIQLLAVTVDEDGEIHVFIEPPCTTSTLSARIDGSLRDETLLRLRTFRNELVGESPIGREFNQILDVFGPVFIDALHAEDDRDELGGHIAKMLVGAARERGREHLKREVIATAERLVEAEKHARREPDYVKLVVQRAIRQVRHAAAQGQDLATALREAEHVFERHHRDDDDDDDR